MKRFVTFALLGPPLGLFAGLGILLPTFNWVLEGKYSAPDWHDIVLLPMAYMLGIIPALVTAGVDTALANWRVRWRPLWTASFAFMASFIPLAGALLGGFVHGPFILLFGLIGV